MRYLIDHVLEGVNIRRAQMLQEAEDRLRELADKAGAQQDIMAKMPDRLITGMNHVADELDNMTSLQPGQWEELVTRHIKPLLNDMPAKYEWDRLQQDLERAERHAASLRGMIQSGDSDLEVFLRAVKEGGETHVSQHALKQAGFDTNVTDYIVARATFTKETTPDA